MTEQQPSIGRNVHYVAYGTPGGEFPAGAHRAAIITQVHEGGVVGLAVLNPTGLFFHERVPYDATGQQPGTWHWSEFVAPSTTAPADAGRQVEMAMRIAKRFRETSEE
jgi:hypothetical protein